MAEDTQAKSGIGPRRSSAWALTVFVIALVVRVLYLLDGADSPSYANPVVDAQTYDYIARALASGWGIDAGLFWQPIFYPLFLAAVYKVVGTSILLVKVLQAIVGASTCVLVFELGRRMFSRNVGVVAGLIMALYGPAVFVECELLAEGWAMFWAALLLLLLLRAPTSRSPFLFFALGLVAALAVLTRPTFIPFLVIAIPWLALTRMRTAEAGHPTMMMGLLVVGFALAALPAASLTRVKVGRFTILPFGSGINLFIGNNPRWEETVSIRPGAEWSVLIDVPSRHGAEGPWESSAFFQDRVRRYALEQPGRFMEGLFAKADRFFCSREIPRNSEIYVQRRWSLILRGLVWKAGRFGFPFGVLLPLALIGLVLNWRRLPAPFWLFLVLYPLSVILYFVSDRYRLPYIPALAVLAGSGIAGLFNLLKGKEWGRFILLVACGVCAGFLASLTPAYPEEQIDYEAELCWAVGRSLLQRGNSDEAIRYFRKTLERQPGFLDANNDLGVIMEKRGKPERAIGYYRAALERHPGATGVLYNLGSALLNAEQYAEAVEVLEKAVRINPSYADARANLAVAYARQGRHDNAIEQYHLALEQEPDSPSLLTNLGHSYATLSRFPEAVMCYERALELNPENEQLRERIEVLKRLQW